jgi:tetratricopeptide (TPR) repeat protein
MRLSARHAIATAILVGGVVLAPVAYASAPPTAERPVDQARGGANSATAIERERRYAGLSLADAIRQSLIDDDLEFTFTSMSALGQAAGENSASRYFSGVRSFARGDYADVLDVLKAEDSQDMLVAAVRTWSLIGQGKSAEAVRAWDAYGDSGQKPFYASYRALMAEQAGQTDVALRNYRIAESTGELVLTKDLAKRYGALLAKAGKDRDALRMFDGVFGETKALDADEAAFRASLAAKRPLSLDPITPRSAVSGMMTNYGGAQMLVRMLRDEPETRQKDAPSQPPKDERAEADSDRDSQFVGDALTFRTAVLIDPTNVSARFFLAQMFSTLDEDEAAQKALEPITTGPRVNEARLTLAGTYASLENPKRGLEVLDTIPEAARDANWWDRRGDLLIARGDFAGGLAAAQRSVALARGKGDWAQDLAQLSLVNALINNNRESEAMTIAQTLVTRLEKRNPIRGGAAVYLARAQASRPVAYAAARDALTSFGADGRTKVSIGGLLVKDPATRAEGIALLRQGHAEFPRSAVIMNSLGYSLMAHDIDLIEGFRLLQQAHEARPDSGAIMDSLGRANYKLGNLDEAQRLIERAIELRADSPDPEIFDNLGDVYWHQGRRDDARVQWLKAKAVGGAYDEREALEAKIRDGLKTPAPVRRDVPVIAEPGSV